MVAHKYCAFEDKINRVGGGSVIPDKSTDHGSNQGKAHELQPR